ncbi:MAG: Histidine kinase, partial [Ramlibacter sp.]|nr:Histidine kinase [Ramlibacter sp.]
GLNPERPASAAISSTAALHGRELLQHGFSVEQVVHDYGDLCQAITSLAIETGSPIRTEEFRTLNRCLDNGIADAVVEFTESQEVLIAEREVQALNERLGVLGHDMRSHLNSAMLAVSAIRTGQVGMTGATGAVLDRSLAGLRSLIDRSLADVRVTARMPARRQHVPIDALVADIGVFASLEAKVRGCEFTTQVESGGIAVNADRDMLLSAAGILVHNAFKFSPAHSRVSLRVRTQAGRVLLEVHDQCGGLPPGDPQDLFAPYTQAGADKAGMGLGLAICRRSVEANGGTVSVRDVPGTGCVFTIDLPRELTAS